MNSELFLYNGKIVHSCKEFASYDPELPPISPDWSPVAQYSGYHNKKKQKTTQGAANNHDHDHRPGHHHLTLGAEGRAWQSGCGCSV